MRQVGIVDLGSNTARMVVYAHEPGRWFRLVDQIREPIRLGEGLAREARLSSGAVERGVAALKLFADYAAAAELDAFEVIGTSALRDAANREELLDRVKPLGVDVHILTGEEEAGIGVLAAANGFDFPDAWVMDLGGGSAQISRMRERSHAAGQAYPLGAVRLTETCFDSDPPKERQVEALEAVVAEHLGEVASELRRDGDPLVAMGGTIRNLARAAQKRSGYPVNLLHGYFLPRRALEEVTGHLLTLDARGRARTPGIHPDRADVIVAGALVYRWLLRESGRDGLLISGDGVREGAFFRHFLEAPHLLPDVRRFAVDNLLARYEQPWDHTRHVGKLARRLFHGLEPLHGLGEAEARLLDAAAVLHDVGLAVRYYRHHKHGDYLLSASPLSGFSHREQVLLTLLVRYHHKGSPGLGPFKEVMESGDKQRLLHLAACLRLAVYLERSKAGRVRDLVVEIEKASIRVTLLATEEPWVEIWEARKHGDLFERAFDRELVLETELVETAAARV